MTRSTIAFALILTSFIGAAPYAYAEGDVCAAMGSLSATIMKA